MVKFWPWGAGAEDAASFERTLSLLSKRMGRAAKRNDELRQKSRRVRVMWTLYAGFTYILAALVLVLVTGWRNWGWVEYTVVSVGPLAVYTIRTGLTTLYDYRITRTQEELNRLTKEHDAVIERLKTATKYNTTQQLLEKYGGSPRMSSQNTFSSTSNKKPQQQQQQQQSGPKKPAQPSGPRTGIAPPPTANIPRPSTANTQQGNSPPPQLLPPSDPTSSLPTSPQPSRPGTAMTTDTSAEFAPNAYDFTPAQLTRQYSSHAAATFTQPHWYDRIMDALLGEDETQPKNRLALICAKCRLVNGQAPPGTRSVEDVGRWRCGECRAWNGVEKVNREEEVVGLVREMQERGRGKKRREEVYEEEEEELARSRSESRGQETPISSGEEEVVQHQPPAKSTRSKARGKGRK